MPRKIVLTGHHHTARLEQTPASEGGIDDGPSPDCDVEPLSDNIGVTIIQSEMHAHGGIPSHEIANEWSNPAPSHRCRRGHLQNAGWGRTLFREPCFQRR